MQCNREVRHKRRWVLLVKKGVRQQRIRGAEKDCRALDLEKATKGPGRLQGTVSKDSPIRKEREKKRARGLTPLRGKITMRSRVALRDQDKDPRPSRKRG